LAIRPVHVGPFGARDEDGIAADGAERAHRAVDAAGDHALSALEELLRHGIAHGREDTSPAQAGARGLQAKARKTERRRLHGAPRGGAVREPPRVVEEPAVALSSEYREGAT